MTVLAFVGGLLVGAFVGVLIAALCKAAAAPLSTYDYRIHRYCEGCGLIVDMEEIGEDWGRTSDDVDLCPTCWPEFLQDNADNP
jgi:hypothetical protein